MSSPSMPTEGLALTAITEVLLPAYPLSQRRRLPLEQLHLPLSMTLQYMIRGGRTAPQLKPLRSDRALHGKAPIIHDTEELIHHAG